MKKPEITIATTDMRVIYIRFRGTYAAFRRESKKMFEELFAFASERGLVVEGKSKVLTLYHDNPFITDEKNLKTSVAMTIDYDAEVVEEGRICTMAFGGKYAVLRYDLALREYDEAWRYAYEEWLFKNEKVKPRNDFPFELYVTEPPKNFKDSSLTDIYIPIE